MMSHSQISEATYGEDYSRGAFACEPDQECNFLYPVYFAYFMHCSERQSARILVKIALRSELPVCGQVKEFIASGRMLCVANVDGKIYAMDNICLHWGGPLGRGTIKDGKVVCPWHGWGFDPKTGEGPPKATRRLAVYNVTIIGEEVLVEL